MKNIPTFITEYGIASITLEKIPYTSQAYITIQKASDVAKLLQECLDFCCAAGAEYVFASGNQNINDYPMFTQIVSMSRPLEGMQCTDAAIFPVQKETLVQWRDIYNEKMRNVPNAAFLTIRDSEKLLESGKCYFVYRGSTLLGIGVVGDNKIDAIATTVPGAGRDVLTALCNCLDGPSVSLEVAISNLPAVRLYEKLGFLKTGIVSTWYKIK